MYSSQQLSSCCSVLLFSHWHLFLWALAGPANSQFGRLYLSNSERVSFHHERRQAYAKEMRSRKLAFVREQSHPPLSLSTIQKTLSLLFFIHRNLGNNMLSSLPSSVFQNLGNMDKLWVSSSICRITFHHTIGLRATKGVSKKICLSPCLSFFLFLVVALIYVKSKRLSVCTILFAFYALQNWNGTKISCHAALWATFVLANFLLLHWTTYDICYTNPLWADLVMQTCHQLYF